MPDIILKIWESGRTYIHRIWKIVREQSSQCVLFNDKRREINILWIFKENQDTGW